MQDYKSRGFARKTRAQSIFEWIIITVCCWLMIAVIVVIAYILGFIAGGFWHVMSLGFKVLA
jgi:t-SNARE complex subunit (syntaxin)